MDLTGNPVAFLFPGTHPRGAVMSSVNQKSDVLNIFHACSQLNFHANLDRAARLKPPILVA